jgi:hypothetical protein
MNLKTINKYHQAPVFVGGFPGSGTRVVSRILSAAGVFMGSRINKTADSVYFAEFLNQWADRYVGAGEDVDATLAEGMTAAFTAFLDRHLQGMSPDTRWGAKNPRNILILPFLHSLFPDMKFIHVLRDGRDLAASPKKRVKIRQYAGDLMGREVVSAGDMVDLWSEITLRGLEFGERRLRDNYLLIRFEDLCAAPRGAILGILDFLGLSDGDVDIDSAASLVRPPQHAVGRWKDSDYDLSSISDDARQLLTRFGY